MSMAPFDYARSAATAKRLLTRFGAGATLRRKTADTRYDPATASMAATWAEYPCTVAAVNYAANVIDGTLIEASDRRLLVAPDVAVQPLAGDVFELGDGSTVTAIRVTVTAPAGVAVLHEVQARGAA